MFEGEVSIGEKGGERAVRFEEFGVGHGKRDYVVGRARGVIERGIRANRAAKVRQVSNLSGLQARVGISDMSAGTGWKPVLLCASTVNHAGVGTDGGGRIDG